ncbi:MAG: hypothetical protein QOD72_2132 [Acidimicrobiaceae bacterium]|nr:hypothetical protein [Acidimicrobiaceae bacterium]
MNKPVVSDHGAVADGVILISSDEASFITGHTFNVDRGYSAN